MAKVSVIIATHSRPHLLTRAVESAFKSGTDVEVVVVDDASRDETADVCRNLPEIKYVRLERNQRTAGARNVGVLASSARYITFLDDDDWRLPDCLDEQVAILENDSELGLVYGQVYHADQQGEILDLPPSPYACPHGDIFWDILTYFFIPNQSTVFRKSCLSKIGLLDASLPGTDDWDLWIRIAELYPVASLEKPVAVWRRPTQGSAQGTSNMTELLRIATEAFRNKWSKLPRFLDAPSEKQEEIRRRFAKNIRRSMIEDVYQTVGFAESVKRFYTVMKYFPTTSVDLYTYKVIASKVVD